MALFNSMDKSQVLFGKHEIYMIEAPTTGITPSATDKKSVADQYLALFVADKTAPGGAVLGSLKRYCLTNSDGVSVKVGQEKTVVDDGNGDALATTTTWQKDSSISWKTGECGLGLLADMFNGDLTTVAAVVGKAGYKFTSIQASSSPKNVSLMLRIPSSIAGQYDVWIVPNASMVPSLDLKVQGKELLQPNVEISLNMDPNYTGANAQYVYCYHVVEASK